VEIAEEGAAERVVVRTRLALFAAREAQACEGEEEEP